MPTTIKQAAVKLFHETGADFTLDQLQTSTGISRATLYRRIGSKEALLRQIADEGLIDLDSQADIDSRIFIACRSVIAEYGFIACTMEQIAKAAGLGVATLYRHFGDKENLLRSFIAQMRPLLAVKETQIDDHKSIEDTIKYIVDNALAFLGDNQDLVKIMFSWQSAERAYVTEIRDKSGSTFSQIESYLAQQQKRGALRRDISAQDLAITLSGLLFQYAIFAPAHLNRPLDAARDSETIVKQFLTGAQNSR